MPKKKKKKKKDVCFASRYWNSKSYVIFSTLMDDVLPLLWFLKHSTIDFRRESEVGQSKPGEAILGHKNVPLLCLKPLVSSEYGGP
ncbi:hypothetical protein V6N13_136026 [Hibiscus sabdariffa]